MKEAEQLHEQLREMDERHDAELHEMEERHQQALAVVAKRLLGRSVCLL